MKKIAAEMKPHNPFLITGYYSPDYFCNRTEERTKMLDALYNGRDVTLIAPRRMGKTGLIKDLFHHLNKDQSGIIALYLDIFSTQNLGDFIRLLADTVLGKLDSAPQKALKRVRQFVKSCHPVVTFDEMTGVPKVSVEIAPYAEEATLKEIFDYLQSTDKRCYIAIDEFQQVAEYPEKGVEALLRSYIQFVPNVQFVFAGSKQHLMQEMFLSAKRPFYQSTQTLSIDRISQEEYYLFSSRFFGRQGRILSREAFQYLYEKFEGHTWYLQVLLNKLFAYRTVEVDHALVDHALQEVIAESSYAYENLLTAYSSGNVRLVKAIAKEGCIKEINSGEFIARYDLKAASSVNSALKKLIHNELIYKNAKGYSVYDRFMAIWLRQQAY